MTTRKRTSPPPLAEAAEPALVVEKPKATGAEDRDRSPPIAIFLSGESFLRVAIHSHEAIEVVSRTWWELSGGVVSGCPEAPIGGGCRQVDHAMKEDIETSPFALVAGY